MVAENISIKAMTLPRLPKRPGESFGTIASALIWLHDDETIVVAASSVTGDDGALMVSGVAANSAVYTTRGTKIEIPIGKGIIYNISSGTAGANYEILFTITTSTGVVLIIAQPWKVI